MVEGAPEFCQACLNRGEKKRIAKKTVREDGTEIAQYECGHKHYHVRIQEIMRIIDAVKTDVAYGWDANSLTLFGIIVSICISVGLTVGLTLDDWAIGFLSGSLSGLGLVVVFKWLKQIIIPFMRWIIK